MERTSIASFLRNGHEVHLYTYGDVDGIPPGTTVRDGREILPAERIFTYREHNSVSGFSNFFRYKLLLERGGWWVDTDMVCVKPFHFDGDYVFSSEGAQVVNCGAIKTPRGSEAMAFAWETCNAKDPAALKWGETGPALMRQVVERFALHDRVQPPHVFCPLPWQEWRRLIDGDDPPELPRDAHAVHLWNELWRRNGVDKDAAHDPRSLYERLKRGTTPAAETAPASSRLRRTPPPRPADSRGW
jgi:hypothetical protein